MSTVQTFLEKTLTSMERTCQMWANNLDTLKGMRCENDIGPWTLHSTGVLGHANFIRLTIVNLIGAADDFVIQEKVQIHTFAVNATRKWADYQEISEQTRKLAEAFQPN